MRARSLFPVLVGAGLLVGAPALADLAAVPAGGNSGQPPVHKINMDVVQLSPIVVNGEHVPFPVALQMIKAAIKRPWSSDRKDADRLVCRFVHIFATHFETLECMTNRQHFARFEQTQAALEEGESQSYHDAATGKDIGGLQVALERGLIQEDIANFMNHHPMNRGQIMTILKALPPAGSSYTLQVLEHGKPVVEYVIKEGKVVGVRRLDDGSAVPDGGHPQGR